MGLGGQQGWEITNMNFFSVNMWKSSWIDPSWCERGSSVECPDNKSITGVHGSVARRSHADNLGSYGTGNEHCSSAMCITTAAFNMNKFTARLQPAYTNPWFFFFFWGDKNEGTVSAIKLKLQRNTTPTWGHSRTAVPHPFDGGVSRWLHKRRGEGDCATHNHRELHERWSLASFGMRQLLHGVCSLLAPPPTTVRLPEPQTCTSQKKQVLDKWSPCPDVPAPGRLRHGPRRVGGLHHNCAPAKHGRSCARTSMCLESWAGTLMFMSRRKTFCRTHAPASRNTRAVISMAVARLFTRPLRVQEAPVTTQRVQRSLATFAPLLP